MNFLDIRTVIFSQLITNALCAGVLLFLWLQNRKRYAGTAFWAIDLGCQTIASLLLILRGSLPGWLSLGFTIPIYLAGSLAGLLGLELFLGKKRTLVPNAILVGVFILFNLYFIYARPSLEARNLNFSLGLAVVCFQCAWLMLRRAGQGLRRMTSAVGWVFALFCLVSLIRIVFLLVLPSANNDFFKSGLYDTLIMLAYQVLLISLTFTLALMVNQRLLLDTKTQEDKFTKAFQSSPYAILITRINDGMIVDVNRGFEEIAGYAPGEAIGKTTPDLRLWVNETDRKQVVAELTSRGRVQGMEFPFRAKSGREITGLFSAEILVIEGERFVLSSINDITERKRAETQLTENYATLNAILESTVTPVFSLDRDYRYTSFNSAHAVFMKALYGVEIAIGKNMLEYQTAADRSTARKNLDRALSGEHVIESAISGEPDRLQHYFEVTHNPIYDPVGEVIGVSVFASDITTRKQTEEALRKSEAQLRAVLDATPFPIALVDVEDNQVDFWSRSALSLFGHTASSAAEWYQIAYPDPDYRRAVIERWKPALEAARTATQAVNTGEYRVTCRDGSVRICELYAAFQAERLIITFNDITGRKRVEEELRRSNADLEQFAYMASHDLQEPLRMVTSYVQLLQRRYKGRLDTDADDFIGFAVNGAGRMQQLITDLLAYSRLGTSGSQPLAPTDCERVLAQTLDNLQVIIQENEAQVTHDPLPTVLGDETQLVQLFQNLVANAIKFHGQQPPLVHISAAENPENRQEWAFAVRDNGIGIDPQFAERIFVIFQRLHTPGEYPGTGIGLAMCKKIVQRHGGRIWVESSPGKGATFYFTLQKTVISD